MTQYTLVAAGLTVRAAPRASPVFGKGPVQDLVAAPLFNSAPKLIPFFFRQKNSLTASSLTGGAPTLDSSWLHGTSAFPMMAHERLILPVGRLTKRRLRLDEPA